jgi:hypothetical protein
VIRLYLIALAGLTALWPQVTAAQSSDPANEAVRVGDRWVYETRDEATGYPKDTYSQIVTEVSKNEIVANLTVRGKNGSVLVVFNHNWGVLDNVIWKYKPDDGEGIPPGLAVGKEWRSQYEAKNTQSGTNMKGTTSSKVVAQETITTSAGTFDAFKIERQTRELNTADPSKSFEGLYVTWFAPQINHWVRRTFLTKYEKRTRTNTSEELTDFSRNF